MHLVLSKSLLYILILGQNIHMNLKSRLRKGSSLNTTILLISISFIEIFIYNFFIHFYISVFSYLFFNIYFSTFFHLNQLFKVTFLLNELFEVNL